MLVRRRAAFRKIFLQSQPQHPTAASTRLRGPAERRIRSEEGRQVLITVEINCAKPTRGFAKVNGYIDILKLKQCSICFRLRRLKRPLHARDQRLLRSLFAGNKEDVLTEHRTELLQRIHLTFPPRRFLIDCGYAKTQEAFAGACLRDFDSGPCSPAHVQA
jgi:hypothetical protein